MTQEDKELLSKDLCARLPYNVKVNVKFYDDYDGEIQEYTFVLNSIDTTYPRNCYWIGGERLQESGKFKPGPTSFSIDIDDEDEEVKPYLRPMSSMTEEEWIKFYKWANCRIEKDSGEIGSKSRGFGEGYEYLGIDDMSDALDWLNEHHFDYRGLIEKGLALEAQEGMYKTE